MPGNSRRKWLKRTLGSIMENYPKLHNRLLILSQEYEEHNPDITAALIAMADATKFIHEELERLDKKI